MRAKRKSSILFRAQKRRKITKKVRKRKAGLSIMSGKARLNRGRSAEATFTK